MNTPEHNPNIRRGRFLWRGEKERSRYLLRLQERIDKGVYYSDRIISRVVDELIPAFSDEVERGYSP
jgi:adenylate kinase family enzyme